MKLSDLTPDELERYEKWIDRIDEFYRTPEPMFIGGDGGAYIPLFKSPVTSITADGNVTVNIRQGDGIRRVHVTGYEAPLVREWIRDRSVNRWQERKRNTDNAIKSLEMNGWDNMEEEEDVEDGNK